MHTGNAWPSKPGTSKSLAVELVQTNLQGKASENSFLRALPAVQTFSYQCSPLSTSEGIEQAFASARRYKVEAANTVVIVLLDEVGLAEQSPHLPLKVLHKVLDEAGTNESVVGISNWALDPAKVLPNPPQPTAMAAFGPPGRARKELCTSRWLLPPTDEPSGAPLQAGAHCGGELPSQPSQPSQPGKLACGVELTPCSHVRRTLRSRRRGWVSEFFPLIVNTGCLSPELQWQSRGNWAYLTGAHTGNAHR